MGKTHTRGEGMTPREAFDAELARNPMLRRSIEQLSQLSSPDLAAVAISFWQSGYVQGCIETTMTAQAMMRETWGKEETMQ